MSDFEKAFIAAGNDYAALSERACGDRELIRELMNMFAADDNWRKMCSSIDACDAENAFRAAHSLKGSSGMMGFNALFEEMKIITDMLRCGDLEGAKSILDSVRAEYDKAVKLITELLE